MIRVIAQRRTTDGDQSPSPSIQASLPDPPPQPTAKLHHTPSPRNVSPSVIHRQDHQSVILGNIFSHMPLFGQTFLSAALAIVTHMHRPVLAQQHAIVLWARPVSLLHVVSHNIGLGTLTTSVTTPSSTSKSPLEPPCRREHLHPDAAHTVTATITKGLEPLPP